MTDSISLRVDYQVPVLVTTKSGQKLASGYDIRRFVLPHRIGVDDYEALGLDSQKLWEMFRPRFEAKIAAEAAGWPVHFRGISVLRHPWEETPALDDPRWV